MAPKTVVLVPKDDASDGPEYAICPIDAGSSDPFLIAVSAEFVDVEFGTPADGGRPPPFWTVVLFIGLTETA